MNNIELVTGEELEKQLFKHLQACRMPESFLYAGDEGAKNWLRLSRSGEYPPAGNLEGLLLHSMSSLRQFIAPGTGVASIGAGSGLRERIILEKLAENNPAAFFPVNISDRLVKVALDAVQDIPVEKTGIVGRFGDLPKMRKIWGSPVLLCVPGNRFSQYEPEYFFRTIHRNISLQDILLFDCSLIPATGNRETVLKEMEQACRSCYRVLFPLSPLLRYTINPDDCELDLNLNPTTTEAGLAYRIRKTIRFQKNCTLSCGARRVFLWEGDVLELGHTYLYRRDQVEALTHRYGFTILALYGDSEDRNLLVLARKGDSKFHRT